MEETEITISNPSPVSEVKLDNFQNTFVGRYNELLYIFEKKVTNLNEIVKLIEPYIEIEKTYFQNFEKFVKQNKNFTGTGSITGNSNMFDSSFDPKLSETFDLFKHWLNVLHSSSDTALKRFKAAKEDLEKFNTEFDQEKKKFLSYLTTHQKELSSSTKKLFKARDKYYKTCREELSLPSPDTVKMSSEKEAYNYHIRIVNNAYEKFFKNNFPAKLSEIESLFIKRLRKIQSVLDSVINSKIDSFKELNDSINGQLLSAISSIKVEDEIDEITRKYNPSNDPFTKTIAFTFQEYSEKQPISQSILANAVVESPIHLIPSVSSHEMVETAALSPSTATLSPKLVHTRSKHDFDASLNLSSVGNEPLNGSAKKTKNPFRMITSRRNHEKRRSNDFGSNGLVPPSPLEGCANNLDSPANSKVSSEVASPVVVPGDVIVTQSEVAVMKVPLEVLMEREKEKEKRLCEGEGVREGSCGVPEVERFLVESLMLLDLQGLKGVFKRGGKMPLINELKKSLDDGKFVRPTDPYVCADVLKLWLRNLPEPLVPNEL